MADPIYVYVILSFGVMGFFLWLVTRPRKKENSKK